MGPNASGARALTYLTVFVLAPCLWAARAHAQEWPADAAWHVLRCGRVPSFDPLRDQAAAEGARDVVGNAEAPALYVSDDEEFVFFRMRVDQEPRMGNGFVPHGWAVELDLDFDRRTYELIGIVDANGPEQEVRLGENTDKQLNRPADEPEQTVARYDLDTHARAVEAQAPFLSTFGDDPDYFVDWALSRADLMREGVDLERVLRVVMGTSTDGLRIDADVACHDGGRGAASFGEAVTDPFHPDDRPVSDRDGDGLADDEEDELGTDPDRPDSDGDGTDDGDEVAEGSDPNDGTSGPGTPMAGPEVELRGGGGPTGCTVRPTASGIATCTWLGLSALWLSRSRRSRRRG